MKKFDESKLNKKSEEPTMESLQKELDQTKLYCQLYARLYNELKLEFIQLKHLVQKETGLYPSRKFVNFPNGFTIPDETNRNNHIDEDESKTKTCIKLDFENGKKFKRSVSCEANPEEDRIQEALIHK